MTISWKGNAKHNHAGRDAELGKLTYIIGGNYECMQHYGKQYGGSSEH